VSGCDLHVIGYVFLLHLEKFIKLCDDFESMTGRPAGRVGQSWLATGFVS